MWHRRTRLRSPTGCSRVREPEDERRSRARRTVAEFNDRDAPAPEAMRTLPFPSAPAHWLESLLGVAASRPLTPLSRSCPIRCWTTGAGCIVTGSPDAVSSRAGRHWAAASARQIDLLAAAGRQSNRHQFRRQSSVQVAGGACSGNSLGNRHSIPRLEMPTPDPEKFADQWVRAWNAHDVEAVLAHFHDDVVFTSPVAAQVLSGFGGMSTARSPCATPGLPRWRWCPTSTSSSSACTAASRRS